MSEIKTLGKLLTELRKRDKGCTQQILSDRMGTSPQNLSHWETNRRPPPLPRLQQYVKMYGVSLEKLVELKRNTSYFKEDKYRYESIDQFLDRVGWDLFQFQRYIFDNNNHFNNGLSINRDIHGTPEQWAEITADFTELLVVISDVKNVGNIGSSIYGYWQLIPIKYEYFDSISKGKILDSEITLEILDDLLFYKRPFDMYGVAVMSKGGGGSGLGNKDLKAALYRSYHNTLESLAASDYPIYIRRICAIPETAGGKRACVPIGLDVIETKQKITNHSVYCGSYEKPSKEIPIFEDNEKLYNLYSKNYPLK